jgi:hypothetical protein
MSHDDEKKKLEERMHIIYKALDDGWTVKKSSTDSKTFEFTKNQSLNINYRGLIIFSNKPAIFEELQKHLSVLNSYKGSDDRNFKRSVSTPILKS